MTVYCLLTVNPKTEKSCTLVLDSIRIGFPTADIRICYNGWGGSLNQDAIADSVFWKCKRMGLNWWRPEYKKVNHARWIEDVITRHREGPMAIVDGDMVFWSSCEKFDNPFGLLAGYYVPMMYNDFAQCLSMPRLHTSFLWIDDAKRLLEKIKEAYPNAHREAGEYCPVDPYGPRIMFSKSQPIFWDTCSVLYNMVGGKDFCEDFKATYTHLNSAGFYDVMLERLENKVGFQLLHSHFAAHPEELRQHDYNHLVDEYYEAKHLQGMKLAQQFDFSL